MTHFTEATLEEAVIALLAEAQIPHTPGGQIRREETDVLLHEDLKTYLQTQYGSEDITPGEIQSIIRQLEVYPSSALYDSNKAILKLIADGFVLKREDRTNKDLFIQLLDYRPLPSQQAAATAQELPINAKSFIGDENVINVESREDLKFHLQGRNSGGVYLTTIHKFAESTELLTSRSNVICISDEAHRSQVNLDQKLRITAADVEKKSGFVKYLHDSLPNATYVGFTGTPIDATIEVFGKVVDAYTMKESVDDNITVKIVYEGRAAKVLLNDAKLREIEAYYKKCAEEGTNEYQIEESKKAVTQMEVILGDPNRLKLVAADFVQHYETRLATMP